jgi:hypothetical protein
MGMYWPGTTATEPRRAGDEADPASSCKETLRYLTRHGDSRIARLILVAPTTPLLRQTADNPDGLDPVLIEANYAAVAADVPGWCAAFEAAGPSLAAQVHRVTSRAADLGQSGDRPRSSAGTAGQR